MVRKRVRSSVLPEFGDTSSYDLRKKHFDLACSLDKGSSNFMQFIYISLYFTQIFHNLMGKVNGGVYPLSFQLVVFSYLLLQMVYKLTIVSQDPPSQSLAASFRTIDKTKGRIRGLDVVQQLQALLF
jgi:hypothetical protein